MERKTTEQFKIDACKIHGYTYDYSLSYYKSSIIPVIIICKIHGEFLQRPNNHINAKNGCPKCCNNIKSNTKSFIEKAILVHGYRYNYSLINYIDAHTNVIIICKIHGEFSQKPNKHLSQKSGCSKCANNIRLTTTEFINKANIIHNCLYNYEYVEYINTSTEVIIVCFKHGRFTQIPESHLQGRGCPRCKMYKGETVIECFLLYNKIEYIYQHKFEDCKYIKTLFFDFYLPNYNLAIEYDGEMHYKKTGLGNKLELQKIRDNIKTKYCEINNIRLLRIPYWDFKNIEKKIESELKNESTIG